MIKNKYVVGGISVALVIVLGDGFWAWQKHEDKNQPSLSQQVETGKPSQNVIPLTPAGAVPSDSGGLQVGSSSAASSIGQLDGSQSKANSGSAAPAIDPSKFGQYDQYKNNDGALFGDAQVGTGAELTAGHKAAVYYRGWLTSGQLFDQSRTGSDGKLQPFIFGLGEHQVIPGWEQGLIGMKVGGVRLLIVPPAVGYGAAGQGSIIPPNAVLVFQIQLLEVQ